MYMKLITDMVSTLVNNSSFILLLCCYYPVTLPSAAS